jgi:hypothetical protein
MAESLISQFSSINLSEKLGYVSLSQKGKPQLCFKAHYYKVVSTSSDKASWRCVKNHCYIKCETKDCVVGQKYDVKIDESLVHNHPSNSIKFSKLEKRRLMSEKVLYSDELPRKIMAEYVKLLTSEEEIAQSSSNDADRQFINRKKKKIKPKYLQLPMPEKLSDIDLPRELTLDANEKNLFLLYDSGKEDPDRFFIFCTEKKLKLIENAHLFADGTFDIAPNLFLQVYSIHVLIENKTIVSVFALLPRKTQKIYESMLNVIALK